MAHANLMAAAVWSLQHQDSASYIAEFIQDLAQLVEDLAPEEILRDINEDRLVSGFPEIKTIDLVEVELSELKESMRKVIIDLPRQHIASQTVGSDDQSGRWRKRWGTVSISRADR